VWDEARSGHVAAGTFGEYVLSDALRVSGSSSAADGLEAAVSGATPLPSNVTQFGGAAGTFASGRAEVNVSHVGGSAEDLPTATALATVDSNVDAILVDTGTTIPALLGTPAADLAADIAAIKSVADAVETDTQDIQSRLPAALSAGGFMMADMEAVNGVSLDGDGSVVSFTV
jgi:hypothetical protein